MGYAATDTQGSVAGRGLAIQITNGMPQAIKWALVRDGGSSLQERWSAFCEIDSVTFARAITALESVHARFTASTDEIKRYLS